MVNEDGSAAVAVIGKFSLELRIKTDLRLHLVDQNALPRLGCAEDLVRGFRLFAAPRNLGHGAKEAASSLGRRHLGQSLGDFPVLGYLL